MPHLAETKKHSLVHGTAQRAKDAVLRLSLPLPQVYSQLYSSSASMANLRFAVWDEVVYLFPRRGNIFFISVKIAQEIN